MGLRQNIPQIDFHFTLFKMHYSNAPALTFIVENIVHYIGFFFAQNGGCISREDKTIMRQRNFHTNVLQKTEHIQNVQFMTIIL